MKTQIKRGISVVMAILMLVALVPIRDLGVTAQAAETGTFIYVVSNGEATMVRFYYGEYDEDDINDFINAYYDDESYDYTYYSDSCEYGNDLVIPDTFGDYPVTTIGWFAFEDCTGLKSITIPDSVTNIGYYVFRDCSSLTSITIPDSVTSIGDGAFSYCSSLKSITIPDSVTSIGEYAFDGCSSLKSLTIPDSVTSIGGSAFYETGYYNNSSNWKNGVLYIGNHLIKAKDSIKGSYKIKFGTKCIAGYAFHDCTGLTSVTIPDSVTSIGGGAFYNCSSLTSVTIPDSVTSIGECAFDGCNSLKSVTIPASVTDIGYEAFGYCNYNKIYDFIISGYVGTAAEQYADENEFKFIDLATHTHTHSYTSKVTKKATCTKSGTRTYTCECGDSYTEKIDSLGHNYSSKWTVDKKATCTVAGSKSHHCTRCDDKANVTEIKATGHDYGDWETINKATCTNTGKQERTCSVCKAVDTRTTKMLGHNYSSKWTVDKKATCTKAGSKSHHCTRCNAKKDITTIEAAGHSYKTTTVKATTSKSGSKTTKCTVCGNVKSKSTIAKISSITLSHDTFTYNGNVKQPTVTVKDSKGNTLKKGTDYTVKYSSSRKNVGKYTVTVTFKGKYSGTKKLTFKIKPRSTSISKLTAGKKQFTATWYKRTEQTSGYQLEYSTSSSMKNASRKTYTTTSKNTRTITGLKSAKKYYVRIRTYKNVKIDGKTYKYYSSWSSIKSVKTK